MDQVLLLPQMGQRSGVKSVEKNSLLSRGCDTAARSGVFGPTTSCWKWPSILSLKWRSIPIRRSPSKPKPGFSAMSQLRGMPQLMSPPVRAKNGWANQCTGSGTVPVLTILVKEVSERPSRAMRRLSRQPYFPPACTV